MSEFKKDDKVQYLGDSVGRLKYGHTGVVAYTSPTHVYVEWDKTGTTGKLVEAEIRKLTKLELALK